MARNILQPFLKLKKQNALKKKKKKVEILCKLSKWDKYEFISYVSFWQEQPAARR